MGWRLRKSKNLGGGFRVNISKSGLGGSWGTRGMRFTKTATGRNRTTFTLPGTGISHVSESGGKKKNRKVSESTAPARKRKRVNSAGLLNICAVVSSVISVAIGSNFGLTAGIIVFLVLVIISAIICSIKGK